MPFLRSCARCDNTEPGRAYGGVPLSEMRAIHEMVIDAEGGSGGSNPLTDSLDGRKAMTLSSDILLAAADLIEPEGAWVRDGGNLRTCWCASEAINACGVGPGVTRMVAAAMKALMATVGLVEPWNDAPAQTQSNVVATLRSVGRELKDQGK